MFELIEARGAHKNNLVLQGYFLFPLSGVRTSII